MIDIEYIKVVIEGLIDRDKPEYAIPAREFMETKTWNKPAKQLSDKIEEITNVQK